MSYDIFVMVVCVILGISFMLHIYFYRKMKEIITNFNVMDIVLSTLIDMQEMDRELKRSIRERSERYDDRL